LHTKTLKISKAVLKLETLELVLIKIIQHLD